jgi:hypothetical protein
MSVFNAIEHQIDEVGDQPSPDTRTQEPEDDLLFADNPEEDAAESNYTGTRLTFSDDELSDSFRSISKNGEDSRFDADEDDANESIDESWAEAMLSDDAPGQKPGPRPQPEPEPERKQPGLEPELGQEPEKDEYDGFFIDEQELSAHEHEKPSAEPESPYHSLRHEPIAISGGNSGRLRGFLWFLVILALLGGLVSQVVWFQFDRLSSIPQLRPLYVQGCEIFGCELKPLVDVQSIQSRKLVVKTDPENRSQLVVDAVIINRASFEQPFPAIALTFSNLNNDVVAQSVFTPDEYLAGDGQTLDAMPVDTPVRILINVRDPGKDAVNYNIVFRANTP